MQPLPDSSQLMHLMETDLSSEWERAALQDLSAAPQSEPPPSLEAEKAAAAAEREGKAGKKKGGASAEGQTAALQVCSEQTGEQMGQQEWDQMSEAEQDAAWASYWQQCYSSSGYLYGADQGGYYQQNGAVAMSAAPASAYHGWDAYASDPYSRQYHSWQPPLHPPRHQSHHHSHRPPRHMHNPQLHHPNYSHAPWPHTSSSSSWQHTQWPEASTAHKSTPALTSNAAETRVGSGSKAGASSKKKGVQAEAAGSAAEEEGEELSDAVLFGRSVGENGMSSEGVRVSGKQQGAEGTESDENEEESDEEEGSSSGACSDVPGDEDLDDFAATLLDKLDVSPPPSQPKQQRKQQAAGHGTPMPPQAVSSQQPQSTPYPYPHHDPYTYSSDYYDQYPDGSFSYEGPHHQPPPHQNSSTSFHAPPPPSFPPSFPSSNAPVGGPPLQCANCALLSFQAQYNNWVQQYSHW